MNYSKEHIRNVSASDPLERQNQEIKRRVQAVVLIDFDIPGAPDCSASEFGVDRRNGGAQISHYKPPPSRSGVNRGSK